MGFRILADATVVLHLGFVLFVIFGGLLVARCPWIAWIHLPSAVWGAWVEFAGWGCPLTPLENWLRQQAGGPAYTSSFIEHYLMPILYPSSLSRELQWSLGGLVILVNAACIGCSFAVAIGPLQLTGVLLTPPGSIEFSFG